MKRSVFFTVFLLFFVTVLCAQTMPAEETDPEIDEPVTVEAPKVQTINQFGDQFVQLGGAVSIPFAPKKLNVGGNGALSYTFYFSRWFSLGATAGFSYGSTLGSNVFYFIPIMVRPSFHLYLWRFEFPISVAIGGAYQAYIDRNYFGMCVKPEVGMFYRFSASWSFGVTTGLFVIPQWYDNPEYNRTGLIMDVAISARYHF